MKKLCGEAIGIDHAKKGSGSSIHHFATSEGDRKGLSQPSSPEEKIKKKGFKGYINSMSVDEILHELTFDNDRSGVLKAPKFRKSYYDDMRRDLMAWKHRQDACSLSANRAPPVSAEDVPAEFFSEQARVITPEVKNSSADAAVVNPELHSIHLHHLRLSGESIYMLELEIAEALEKEEGIIKKTWRKLVVFLFLSTFPRDELAQEEFWFRSTYGKAPDIERFECQEMQFYDLIAEKCSEAVEIILQVTFTLGVVLALCFGWRHGLIQDWIGFVEVQ